MSVTTKAGSDGFKWFFGVVEDRNDEKMLGRVRVRVYNTHPQQKSLVNTGDLHWATVIMPPTSAGTSQIGSSPTGMVVGTTVFGFFADAGESQIPIVLGTLAGIPKQGHDVPVEARGTSSVSKTALGPEPASAFGAKYPYNKVTKTEGGHIIEVDDTPGAERLHVYHKSGTYVEIAPDGRLVTKTAGSRFDVTVGEQTVYIGGTATIQVQGDVNMTVVGTVTGSASSWNLTGDVNVTGNINATAEITDKTSSMTSMRATFNAHDHADPQGGKVSPTSGTM